MLIDISPSAIIKIIDMIKIMIKTTIVVVTVSLRVGQVTFMASCRVSRTNWSRFFGMVFYCSFFSIQSSFAKATGDTLQITNRLA